jgi:hypothetical protein
MDAVILKISALVRDASDGGDDALFELIGKYNPDTIYALPQDPAHLAAAGKQWFASRAAELRQLVCSKEETKDVAKLLSDEFIASVFGLIAAAHGKALAVYVTAIVIRRVIRGWCIMASPDES